MKRIYFRQTKSLPTSGPSARLIFSRRIVSSSEIFDESEGVRWSSPSWACTPVEVIPLSRRTVCPACSNWNNVCTGNRRHTGRQEFLILHTRSRNAPITIPRECTRFSTYARHIPRLARLPGSRQCLLFPTNRQLFRVYLFLFSFSLFHSPLHHSFLSSILLPPLFFLLPRFRSSRELAFNHRDELLSTSMKTHGPFRGLGREESWKMFHEWFSRASLIVHLFDSTLTSRLRVGRFKILASRVRYGSRVRNNHQCPHDGSNRFKRDYRNRFLRGYNQSERFIKRRISRICVNGTCEKWYERSVRIIRE